MNSKNLKINFKEWLIEESSSRVVLMKAVHNDGADSIKKSGFQLQDKHRSVANYYKKYGDTEETQMYGPGLYFTIVPVGQNHIEYAKKNCGMYAKAWGNNILFATIRPGSLGLVTGFPGGHPMYEYSASKNTDIYSQLEALGVNDIIGYKKSEIHTREEWGYKLHEKIDFWAHSHWSEGGVQAYNIVVYNPSILQNLGGIECNSQNEMAGTGAIVTCKDIGNPNFQIWGSLSNLNCRKKRKKKLIESLLEKSKTKACMKMN